MALNYIWVGFFIVAFIVAIFRVLRYHLHDFFDQAIGWAYQLRTEDRDVFSAIVDSTFTMAETSVKISIVLIGVMTLWLGIMKIGEKGGAVGIMSKTVNPLFGRLFPDIDRDSPAMGAMLMNICANMLGLDNAATPFGIKAMEELQKQNSNKDTASNAQIMFIVLNTSGLTLIPISVLAYRAAEGAANPTDVFLPILLTTFFSTLAGIIAVSLIQKINLLNKVVLAYLGGLSIIVSLSIFGLFQLDRESMEVVTRFAGSFILFSFIIFFIALAMRKRINIYETFIEGATEGFGIAIKIIPYLVAMLVAIGVFRASGAMDLLLNGLAWVLGLFFEDTEFVKALPTAFMKPLSGSGARGMMLETFTNYGVDSFPAKLAATFQGSTETTFYTIAVYFGAIGVRKTRYAVGCGLIADFTAIVAGIIIATIFFK